MYVLRRSVCVFSKRVRSFYFCLSGEILKKYYFLWRKKNMFKKTLAIVLALVMTLSMLAVFASCGKDEKEKKGMSESPLAAPTLKNKIGGK